MVAILVVAATVVAFSLVSSRLRGRPITPPMLFVAAGLVVGPGALGLVHVEVSNEVLRVLAEATLVVVLFTDASRMQIDQVWRQHDLPMRLLLVGVPLAIALGALLGRLLFPALGLAGAALLAAVLAPTDAALGQAVVTDRRIPVRIRQTLNVESGLNDGLSVPFIALLTEVAAHREATAGGFARLFASQVGIGVAVGAVVGYAGGRVIAGAVRRHWTTEASQRLASVALAGIAYTAASAAHGNGFIATFVAGLVFAAAARDTLPVVRVFAEAEGELLTLVTFLLFGAAVVSGVLGDLTWRIALYAVASLALVRLVAVALSLAGTHLRGVTVGFIGWFGPRGLASIVFALLVVDSTGVSGRGEMFTVATWTVIASVFLHGVTAAPGAGWYGRRMAESPSAQAEHRPAPETPTPLHARSAPGGTQVAHHGDAAVRDTDDTGAHVSGGRR